MAADPPSRPDGTSTSPTQKPLDDEAMAATAALVDAWLERTLSENPMLAAVERDPDHTGGRRWFVRLLGESRDTFAIWFTLRQRMLHFETWLLPPPEEDRERFFEHLLRRNRSLVGVSLCIGDEDAVYLVGAVPADTVDGHELDRLLGTVWEAVERCFQPALRIGFASRLKQQ